MPPKRHSKSDAACTTLNNHQTPISSLVLSRGDSHELLHTITRPSRRSTLARTPMLSEKPYSSGNHNTAPGPTIANICYRARSTWLSVIETSTAPTEPHRNRPTTTRWTPKMGTYSSDSPGTLARVLRAHRSPGLPCPRCAASPGCVRPAWKHVLLPHGIDIRQGTREHMAKLT